MLTRVPFYKRIAIFGWRNLVLLQTRCSSVLTSLRERGLVSAYTSEDMEKLFEQNHQTIYCGFDPTARSLHIGNMLAIMGMIHCLQDGHNVIALVGGATGRIGDPSGRSTERTMLPEKHLQENIQGITNTLNRIITNARQRTTAASQHLNNAELSSCDALPEASYNNRKPPFFKIVNNDDWYQQYNVIDFIADVGRHFRVGSMLAKESVRSRMENAEGISFTEFAYQVLQGNDFLHLYRTHDCRVQLGGSDQWGNITAGIDLIRRVTGSASYGMTIPLLTTSSGEKFGKSVGNAIWLDEELTSPYDLYQFFVNVPDEDVEKYLKALTLLSGNEVQSVMKKHETSPHLRTAQYTLAAEVVDLVHGKVVTEKAAATSHALFQSGSIEDLPIQTLTMMFADAPAICLDHTFIEQSPSILDVCVKSGLVASKAAGKRAIKAGGIYLNNKRIHEDGTFSSRDILGDALTILRHGKKQYLVIRWQD